MPNTAPAGSSLTRTIPRSYRLHKSDFGFSDGDGNAFKAVVFTTLPGAGTLYYDSNGPLGGGRTAVVAGQTISAADILAGKLTYVAPAGMSGANYDHFTFQVQDDGGTAGGGVDTDQSPNTLTFDLVATPAAPATFGGTIDLGALSAAGGFKIQGDAQFDDAGSSVSSAGDVNGDGFDDFIVGAKGNDKFGLPSNPDAGAAYVIFGKASGFGSLIDLTGLAAADGFKIQGEANYNEAGISVSSAGDVNGDGFADILVGAWGNKAAGQDAGAAYVIFGKASGFGSIDLAALSAADGFKIQAAAAGDHAGRSVSTAGDVNGDGFADIIVGAYGDDGGGNFAGAAYVIFGKASGFGSLINLATLSATDGFKIQGDADEDIAGRSVSSAGDINGDGFADMLVSAEFNDSGGSQSGAAYVIFGKSSGFGSLVDLATLPAADGFKIQGDADADFAGRVSSAGDINGDGFADIIIGAIANDSGGNYSGAAYVIFGKSGGFGSLIDLGNLAAAEGFKIQGDATYDRAGFSVSSAGDVNGDGFADILVGTSAIDGGGLNAGGAYLIYGKAGGFGSLIDLASLSPGDGFKILGDAPDDYAGRSVSSAGDVNGDGFADIIIGAVYNDSGGNFAGAAYVIFGGDTAPFQTANAGLTLNEGATSTITSASLAYHDVEQANAAITYTVTSAATNGTLKLNGSALGVGGTFTQDDIDNGRVSYVHDGSETTSAGFGFSVSDGAGGAATGQSFAITVTPVDDAAIANDDPGNATNENATVNIAVLTNDSDVDSPLSVAKVDGQAITVGGSVTLASGAKVTLEANGTLTYDPNGQFNTLTSPTSGETGAVNTSANDNFTYTLAGPGGGMATVGVTVNGVASAQDHLNGDSGNNNITGTGGGDFFDLSQGGNDTASGLGGDDGFFFGAAFTAADHVDGGAGTNDQIGLQGDYSGANALTLGASTITGIEAIVVLPGFNYNLTTVDANVAAGGVLKIQATQLAAGQSLAFNGSAETDGSFMVFGGQGNDSMTGGAGNDGFYFGPGAFSGADAIDGGGGTNDQLALDGDYGSAGSPFLLGGNAINVEAFVLLHGLSATPNHFNLAALDSFVAAGHTMTVFGLQVETDIVFDGSGEHDGAFKFYGGSGNDAFIASTGNDWLFGGAGGDILVGGGGSDTYYYDAAGQSTSTGFDRIYGFDDSIDAIDLPFAVTGLAAPASGNLSNASFDVDLSTAFAGLTSHQAGMFTATGGDMAGRTFLVIDADGNAGYQAGGDYVIEIVSPATPVDNPAIFV